MKIEFYLKSPQYHPTQICVSNQNEKTVEFWAPFGKKGINVSLDLEPMKSDTIRGKYTLLDSGESQEIIFQAYKKGIDGLCFVGNPEGFLSRLKWFIKISE